MRAATVMLFGIAVVACAPKPPPKTADDDNAKAFAELDKNDRDDAKAGGDKASASAGDWQKPKGPVYPAPFTAEQIRAATKNGRTYRYKVQVPSQPSHEYAITFRNVDDGGAELHNGDKVRRMSWTILQQHSEFPKEKTTTRDDKLKTPAGKFECIVYEVQGEDGEVWTFYFAKKLPGAPVYWYATRDGRRTRTTTLVEHIPGH